MKLIQVKSKCCKAKVIKHGGKRRQCKACKRTWSVKKRKRGRKAKRISKKYVDKVFKDNMYVKNIEKTSKLKTKNIYKRFKKSLESFATEENKPHIKGDGFIFIIDAKSKYFKNKTNFQKELWTIYSIVVKPIDSNEGHILDPILRKGKESATNWIRIFKEEVPENLKNKALVLVSDGLRGIEKLAEEYNLIHQRCNFHILKELRKRVGKRKTTKGRNIRKAIYELVDDALKTGSKENFPLLIALSEMEDCPKPMKMIIKEFIRRHGDFISYLRFSELNIPKTTNAVESLHALYESKTAKINTPKAWHRWCIAVARYKKKMNFTHRI